MIKNKSFVIRNHSQHSQNVSNEIQGQPLEQTVVKKVDVINEMVDDFNKKINELSSKLESVQSEILTETRNDNQIQSNRLANLEEQVNELSVNFKLIGDLIKQILQKSTQSQ
jgi:hypothetical protein